MKKQITTKTAILFFVCNFITANIHTQTVTYNVISTNMDSLSAISEMAVDSANFKLSSKSENDEIILNFRFVIPDTLSPVKYTFLLGSAPGISDVKEQKGEIVKNNNEYMFISGGYLFPVIHNGLEISFILSKNEYETLSYITVIAEEANGVKVEIGTYNVK